MFFFYQLGSFPFHRPSCLNFFTAKSSLTVRSPMIVLSPFAPMPYRASLHLSHGFRLWT